MITKEAFRLEEQHLRRLQRAGKSKDYQRGWLRAWRAVGQRYQEKKQ